MMIPLFTCANINGILFYSSSTDRLCNVAIAQCLSDSLNWPELCPLPLLVNIPVEGIRLLDAVCLLLGKRRRARQKTFAAVWSQPDVVCSEKVTFDPLTFSKKNPSRAIPRSTYIHPPSLVKIRQRGVGLNAPLPECTRPNAPPA